MKQTIMFKTEPYTLRGIKKLLRCNCKLLKSGLLV